MKKKLSPSRAAAYTAVMCALLIGGQYVFSFVAGVEIVTVLLISFSYVFGASRGAVCALAFSLLRCIIFPFSPSALILYVVYYPALAGIFGGLGHVKDGAFKSLPAYLAVSLVLLGICAVCACLYAFDVIKVSRVYKLTLQILLWVIFSLCLVGLIVFNVLYRIKGTEKLLKLIALTATAAVCTVMFTLLDDLITPLFYGYSRETALAYFYTSVTAMLPQTICTIVTVSTLFMPLTAVLNSPFKAYFP